MCVSSYLDILRGANRRKIDWKWRFQRSKASYFFNINYTPLISGKVHLAILNFLAQPIWSFFSIIVSCFRQYSILALFPVPPHLPWTPSELTCGHVQLSWATPSTWNVHILPPYHLHNPSKENTYLKWVSRREIDSLV